MIIEPPEFQDPVPGNGTASNGPAVEADSPGPVSPMPDTVEGAHSARVTPIPDMEFIALWQQPELTSEDVAERLGIGVRAANKRAHTLGQPPKGIRAKKIQRIHDQLLEAAMPATGGRPDPRLPWLSDPDIAPVFEAYWTKLKDAQTGEDLVRLRPLQLKIHAMVAARYPWALDALQTLADSTKLVLGAQRAEADMPAVPSQVQLRQDAARQIMQEIGETLNEDEKDQMGRLLQLAADRMAERRRVVPPQRAISVNPW